MLQKITGVFAFAAGLAAAAVTVHAQLPEGPGKQAVQSLCLGCHDANRITASGYSAADWKNVVAMMHNVGAPISPDQAGIVTDYLAHNFPEKPRPSPKVIEGTTRVIFHEWVVPTAGSRPHDPLATPDGAIWYSGHMADLIGRVDPRTGAIREFHLPNPNSGPHGLVADAAGNIWYTANFAGAIGKLDPRTGTVTEYPLPDPTARDPHTPVFDRNGTL